MGFCIIPIIYNNPKIIVYTKFAFVYNIMIVFIDFYCMFTF